MVISIRGILAILFLSLTCFLLVSTQTSAQVTYLEDFPDPLGGWTTRWFYQNTNAENYYVATGNCDPNYRGNEPNGMWISDDRGCNTMVYQSPVRINILNNFGDDAISFSIDVRSCIQSTVLNIYDKNGVFVNSQSLSANCSFLNYSFSLSNGISAFEFVNTGGGIEGSTAIDNVTLIKGPTTSVSGTVSYTGLGTGPISIAAFDGSGCGDGNYTEVWIPEPGPYTLNLSPGTYYICACRDTNGNGSCSPGEGEPGSGYDLNPVVVPAGAPVTGIDISLQGQLPPAEKVPTMTEWGMIILIGILGMASIYSLRRQWII